MNADVRGYESFGLVEVHGLSAALVVADVMAKAADVRMPGIESNTACGMGIKVAGSTGDVRAAVEAGEAISRQMNAHIGHVVWPRYSEAADFLIHAEQEYNALLQNNEHYLPSARSASPATSQKGNAPTMSHQDAIGMIEAQGLVGLLEAADAMCKAAAVEIIGKEKIGGAYVTVMVRGDVAAVTAAVESGAAAIEKVGGKLILAHVIARPHAELAALLPTK